MQLLIRFLKPLLELTRTTTPFLTKSVRLIHELRSRVQLDLSSLVTDATH